MDVDFDKNSEPISKTLKNPTKIQRIANKMKDISYIYACERGIHYPIAIEVFSKLKQLTIFK